MVKLVRLSEPSTHLLPELGLLLRVKVSPDPFSMLKKNWLVKTTTFPSCVGRLELLESGDRLTSEREPEVSKLTESWAPLRIFNDWDYADGNVMILYLTRDYGRAGHAAKWQVFKGRESTEDGPTRAWYNHGRKTFNVFGREDKQPQLEEAKAWASEKYGIKEWAKTPYGSWMDADFVKARTKELKQALADAEGVTA